MKKQTNKDGDITLSASGRTTPSINDFTMLGNQVEALRKEFERMNNLLVEKKGVFTTSEAAAYLGMSEEGLYKLMQARQIAYSKPGGKKAYFKREDLENYATQNRFESEVEMEQRLRLERRSSKRKAPEVNASYHWPKSTNRK